MLRDQRGLRIDKDKDLRVLMFNQFDAIAIFWPLHYRIGNFVVLGYEDCWIELGFSISGCLSLSSSSSCNP